MSTVDEILASGRYVDRRGRVWEKRIRWSTSSGRHMWSHLYRLEPLLGGPVYRIIDENHLRPLIERDQHRDACPGLALCRAHPVPFVILWPLATAIPARSTIGKTHYTMGEAIEEARRMAANE